MRFTQLTPISSFDLSPKAIILNFQQHIDYLKYSCTQSSFLNVEFASMGLFLSLTESPKLLFSLNDHIILDQNGSVSPNDAMFFVCLFVFVGFFYVLFCFILFCFVFFKFSLTRCLGLLKLYRFHIWVFGCFNQNFEFTSSEWQFFK